MNIFYEEEDSRLDVTKELLETLHRAGEIAIETEDYIGLDNERCEVSLSFVDSDEIHSLNKEYRGVDSPTDVLSFPQFDSPEDVPEEGEICLGDVVICVEKAKQQAEEYGHSFERELTYLFTHSILHLLGYDHMEEEDKKVMRKREEEIMSRLGIER